MDSTPVFDPSRDYGTIMHGESTGVDVGQMPRFFQDGHYFKPNFEYHSSADPGRVRAAAPVAPPPASIDTLPGVDESEVDALLQDPRALPFLDLTRDHLVAQVTALNGPMMAGEGSTQMMIAWLVKYSSPQKPARSGIADEL